MRHGTLAFFALTLLLGPAARGQTAEVPGSPETPVLAAELARLNATLSDIKALLERVTETQGLDLLMKRMELSSARVIDLEKRLRTAESERAGADEERSRLELSMQSMLAEIESGSMEASAEQLEVFTAHHEAEAARLRIRLRSLDEEIAVLRNDLDAKRRELDDWQTHIDRRLGGV